MNAQRSNSVIAIALFMALTFIAMAIYLAMANKWIPLALFSGIFLALVAFRRKAFVWKACALVFALLTMMFSFQIFGGLEPNSPGVISTGQWLGFDSLLFVMFVLSTMGAIVGAYLVGRRSVEGTREP